MTLNALMKRLNELKTRHGGDCRVCVDTTSIKTVDDVEIADVSFASFDLVYLADPDGGVQKKKDGTEKVRHCIVLK